MRLVFKLTVLLGFTVCTYSEPLLITSGSFGLSGNGPVWSFVGEGFSASGFQDFGGVGHCGFCVGPFQLVNPVPFAFTAANGNLTLGQKSYILPDAGFFGGSPWATGSIFLSPQSALPTVPGVGTYNVPFNIGGTFCVTDNPQVPPPQPPAAGCFSVIGAAVAHYTVVETGVPNAFFQPVPTIEIVPLPEPATLSAGLLGILLMIAAKCRSKLHASKRS